MTTKANRSSSSQSLVDWRLQKVEESVSAFDKKLDSLMSKTSSLHESITVLKVKMAIIGGLSGTVAAAVVSFIANKVF